MRALKCFAASVLLLAGSAAMAAPKSTVIIACYNKETGRARIVNSAAECRRDENAISWNIEGPQGPAGAQGPVGPAGAMGLQGPAGPAGAKGATGAPGPAGPQGLQGATGPAGATGPIGPAGAQGVAGPIGPAGPAGATGPAGPIGLAGPAGATGAIGPVGPAGAMGATGPIGPAGPAGAIGPAGPAGAAGTQGPAGPTGPAGPEGPTGATGPSGTTGIFGTNDINFFTEGGGGVQCTLGSVILNVAVEYPGNYLPADGRTLAITINTALFSLIGTNYGGDGMTTFALPDLRKAAPNNTQYLICVTGIFP
jgi:Phage Tail Collar Domain/Collagen triple helix repeat (20 copies)